jgi:ubiquinone biosynthesis protein
MLRNTSRFLKIIRTFAQYQILDILVDFRIFPYLPIINIFSFSSKKSKESKNERIRMALQELGPTFIKFGQLLSTRSDIVGISLATELSKLQDKVEPSIGDNIDGIFRREFKREISDLFKSFDRKPVASASIAEVFKARTHDDKIVAVKVLRPGIEEEFAKDISLFMTLVNYITKRSKKLERFRLIEVVKLFEKTIKMEMDLRFEAAAASEMKENNRERFVHIPEIYWQYVSKKILTLEWLDGTLIYDKKALQKRKINLKKIGSNLINMFLNQAYQDGFFHADLHPGNVLVKDNGDLILLDFGITGRLDNRTKVYLAEILKGFIERDYQYVAEVHLRAGYISDSVSVFEFAQACRSIGEPIVGVAAKDISVAKLLTHLFKVTEDFNMEVQPQLILIQKTTVMIEGLISILDPKINMWKEAEPWIKKWADENLKFDSRVMMRVDEIKSSIDRRLNSLQGNIQASCQCSNSYNVLIALLLSIIVIILLLKCF